MSDLASEKLTFRSQHTTFVVCCYPHVVEVIVEGEYDLSSVDASQLVLEHVGDLIGAGPRRVIVDLAGVTFFDAAAINFLLRVDDLARLASTTSSVRDPSANVRYVLKIVGLSGLIDGS